MERTYNIEVGGQKLAVNFSSEHRICAMVPPQDGDILPTDPNVVNLEPEDVLLKVNMLRSDDIWNLVKELKNFKSSWAALWPDLEPPKTLEDLRKAAKSIRYTVGAYMALVECFVDRKTPLLQKPETYYHPIQVRNLTLWLDAIRKP